MGVITSQQLQEIEKDHHIVLLPKSHELYRIFGNKIMDFETWGVICSFGEVPELSKDNLVAVYFPKNIEDKKYYDDPENNALELNKTKKLFETILEAGELYNE